MIPDKDEAEVFLGELPTYLKRHQKLKISDDRHSQVCEIFSEGIEHIRNFVKESLSANLPNDMIDAVCKETVAATVKTAQKVLDEINTTYRRDYF